MRSPRETAVWPEWEQREIIGIGGWGRVYRAEWRDHPKIQAAVKGMDVPAKRVGQVLEEIRQGCRSGELRTKQVTGSSSGGQWLPLTVSNGNKRNMTRPGEGQEAKRAAC